MEKVLLTINGENKASIHVYEALGGIWGLISGGNLYRFVHGIDYR